MNLILTHLQHNFDIHMNHNSDRGIDIIGSIFNSGNGVFQWREKEMHYIVNREQPWVPGTSKANTPNANLPSNMQCIKWQTEPDLAAAPSTVLVYQEAQVAVQINNPVAGPRAAAATMIIKTPAPVAIGLTPMNLADNCTNLGVMMAVTRAQKTSRWVIAVAMTMSSHLHIEEQSYQLTVVIVPVWTTKEE